MIGRDLGFSSSCFPTVLKSWQRASTFSSAGGNLASWPNNCYLTENTSIRCYLSLFEEISAEVCLCGFVLGKIVYCVINLEIAALHYSE